MIKNEDTLRSPEAHLFRAIILQTLFDCSIVGQGRLIETYANTKDKLIKELENSWMVDICDYAGISYTKFKKAAFAIINNEISLDDIRIRGRK